MVLRLQLISGEFFKIVCVYGPTMQRSDIKKEHFYHSLDLVVNSNKSDKLIVLGDFNACAGCDSELWSDVLGKHGTGKMKTAQ